MSDETSTEKVRDADQPQAEDGCARAAREWLEAYGRWRGGWLVIRDERIVLEAALVRLLMEREAAARAEEREAAARIAESVIGRIVRMSADGPPPLVTAANDGACREIAAAIRSRAAQEKP